MTRGLAWLALPLLAGCADPNAIPVMKCPTIPTAQTPVHPPPLPPVSAVTLTLVPGHWEWDVGHYVWVSADWSPRPLGPDGQPAARVVWQDGFWTPDGGACVWTAGRLAY